MTYSHKFLLVVSALLFVHHSSLVAAEGASVNSNGCESFETVRDSYNQSLSKDESGKPMASEQSVQVAWQLIGAAEQCLKERSVNYERISTHAVRILPEEHAEPSKTALLLKDLTAGAVIYDVGFFLRKPFAAGGFEQNILFLPHSAILGKVDMITRHELTHARAHSLELAEDWRLRHLWIFGQDTMYLDEVIAYSEGGVDTKNSEKLKTWSLGMAEDYIDSTRKLIEAQSTEIATSMDGQRCLMTPALKKEVTTMLSCVESELQTAGSTPGTVSSCDGPRNEATFCAQ